MKVAEFYRFILFDGVAGDGGGCDAASCEEGADEGGGSKPERWSWSGSPGCDVSLREQTPA